MIGSMGRVGAADHNAAMESFFALLQKNVLGRRTWATRQELRIAIVTWIERTYHRRRRQQQSYGFCRAHAVAFAVPVVQSAWLKAHRPAAFAFFEASHDACAHTIFHSGLLLVRGTVEARGPRRTVVGEMVWDLDAAAATRRDHGPHAALDLLGQPMLASSPPAAAPLTCVAWATAPPDRRGDREQRPGIRPRTTPCIARVHFHLPGDGPGSPFEQLLTLVEGVTPRLRALPPDSDEMDLTGALGYFRRDAEGAAQLVRLWALALYGINSTVGVDPTPCWATDERRPVAPTERAASRSRCRPSAASSQATVSGLGSPVLSKVRSAGAGADAVDVLKGFEYASVRGQPGR